MTGSNLNVQDQGVCHIADSRALQGIHEAIRQCWLEDTTKITRWEDQG